MVAASLQVFSDLLGIRIDGNKKIWCFQRGNAYGMAHNEMPAAVQGRI